MSALKTNFAVKSKYESFYTGGKVEISRDGVYMFCGCGNKVNVFEIATGRVHTTIGEVEDEVITSFCLAPDNQYLVVATQNLLLRQWNWKDKELVRTWKAIHAAPVMSMAFDSTCTLLATGSADSTVKVWDIEKQYCTHNFRGHQGVVSIVTFHPDISRLQLYSAGEDYKVRVWSLMSSSCLAEVGAHLSSVTSIVFSEDGSQIFSSGRDGIVAVWNADQHKVLKTIPVFETIESLVLLPTGAEYAEISVTQDAPHFITAGNKGVLRVWNSKTSRCVYQTKEVHTKPQDVSQLSHDKDTDDGQSIVQLVLSTALSSVAVVTFDQIISLLGVDKLRLQKQFAGNNEEILDVKYFGTEERYVLVATNSMHIKLFELENWDCEILYGHTDIVLCIDVLRKGNRFISSGKDNTVRLWEMDPSKKQVSCLAIGQGHTHSVGAVAFARLKPTFFVSGSEDSTLKLWSIPNDLDPSVTMEIHAKVTEKAHEKAVSCVEVSPNDMFIASGSMDKTAKLWRASDLTLLGVMRGHRRGIWSIQFSPVDQILATASGDCTVKLWSLTDFSCAMTFEGHNTAVLRVSFINRGMQFLSSSTDGLVKLWTIKTNECVRTLDDHEDKVWSLAVNKAGDSFISGAADSTLIVWKDITETEQDEARQKQQQIILQEQELSNLLQQKKYLKAIGLAITLEQPFKVLTIMKEILSDEEGDEKLYKTIEKLRDDQVDAMLRFASKWNTNSRHCHEAQFVISTILRIHSPEQLKTLGNIKSSLEGLLPYSDRHFQRLTRLMQQSMFLEYTWHCMRNVATDRTQRTYEVKMEEATEPADFEASPTQTSAPVLQDSDSETSSESEESEEETVTKPKAAVEKPKQSTAVLDSESNSESESSSESEEETAVKRKAAVKKSEQLINQTKNKPTTKMEKETKKKKNKPSKLPKPLPIVEVAEEETNNNQPLKTPRVNLYKAYLGENREQEAETKQTQKKIAGKTGKGKKRKVTDTFTVVKKKGTQPSDNYFLDKVPNIDLDDIPAQKYTKGDKQSTKLVKPGKQRTKQAKLKKLKVLR